MTRRARKVYNLPQVVLATTRWLIEVIYRLERAPDGMDEARSHRRIEGREHGRRKGNNAPITSVALVRSA